MDMSSFTLMELKVMTPVNEKEASQIREEIELLESNGVNSWKELQEKKHKERRWRSERLERLERVRAWKELKRLKAQTPPQTLKAVEELIGWSSEGWCGCYEGDIGDIFKDKRNQVLAGFLKLLKEDR